MRFGQADTQPPHTTPPTTVVSIRACLPSFAATQELRCPNFETTSISPSSLRVRFEYHAFCRQRASEEGVLRGAFSFAVSRRIRQLRRARKFRVCRELSRSSGGKYGDEEQKKRLDDIHDCWRSPRIRRGRREVSKTQERKAASTLANRTTYLTQTGDG